MFEGGKCSFKKNLQFLERNNIKIYNNLISPKKKILKNIPNKKEVSEIPLTDDENINSNRSMDHRNISFQPQIMKIKKKEKIDIFSYKIKPKGIFRNNNIMDITSNKSYNILERNQSLPFYDNI